MPITTAGSSPPSSPQGPARDFRLGKGRQMLKRRPTRTTVRTVMTIAGGAAALAAAPAAQAVTWSPPITVSAANEQAYQSPRIASDANGDMIVAWLQQTSNTP